MYTSVDITALDGCFSQSVMLGPRLWNIFFNMPKVPKFILPKAIEIFCMREYTLVLKEFQIITN